MNNIQPSQFQVFPVNSYPVTSGTYSSLDWIRLTKDWDIRAYQVYPTTGEPIEQPSENLPSTSQSDSITKEDFLAALRKVSRPD